MIRANAFGSLVAAAFIVVSCGKLQEKPVVDFAMKDFKVESRPNCTEIDSACAIYEIQYPVFLSLDTTVRRSISDRVAYLISDSPGETRSIEEAGNDFIREFNEFIKEIPDYDMSWYQKGRVEVMVASDTLISLQVSVESFTGGAHASYTTHFVNVEPKTGTAYLLDAMLRAGYEAELNRLAGEDIREQLGFIEGDSISGPQDFQLNENYGFRKEGIVFYFNEDEVPSFAEGPTEILIPYEKLAGWIR